MPRPRPAAACRPSSPVPAAPRTCPACWRPRPCVPVLGVPVASRHLQGVDSLHSIVQMPKGVPVATFAIGAAGAANAALFAVAHAGQHDAALRGKLLAWRAAADRGRARHERRARPQPRVMPALLPASAGPDGAPAMLGVMGGGQLGAHVRACGAGAGLPHGGARPRPGQPGRPGVAPACAQRLRRPGRPGAAGARTAPP